MTQFNIVKTPHNSLRLYADRAIIHNESAVKMLDWLSVWGGADKVEEKWPGYSDGIVSWEFESSVSEGLISKAVVNPINYCESGSVYPLEVN
jgi:hypothetical protein